MRNLDLFTTSATGTIPGEGAFMVWMNNQRKGAMAGLEAIRTVHTEDPAMVLNIMIEFLTEHFAEGEMPDLLFTGENGDNRLLKYYEAVESAFQDNLPVARFKHLCGEYCTATSFACWLSFQILAEGSIPPYLIKKNPSAKPVRRILIYNNYRGAQHAFILISAIQAHS